MEKEINGPDILGPDLFEDLSQKEPSEKKNEKNILNNKRNNNEENPKKNIISYTHIINKENSEKKSKNLGYKTCLKNAIIIDLDNKTVNKNDAINIMKEHFSHAYAMNYNHKKNLLEVGFNSKNEQTEAENKEIVLYNKKLYIQKLHHITDIYTVIKATNVNLKPTIKETKELIAEKMKEFGDVKDIFIPLIENKWQEPEASIFIKIETMPPREIDLEGVQMLLNWKGATPRCRFCKRSNHLVKDCRNLKRKLENTDILNKERIAKEHKEATEALKNNNKENDIINNEDKMDEDEQEILDSWEEHIETMDDNETEPQNEEGLSKKAENSKLIKKSTKSTPYSVKQDSKIKKGLSSLSGLSKRQKNAIKNNAEKLVHDDFYIGSDVAHE